MSSLGNNDEMGELDEVEKFPSLFGIDEMGGMGETWNSLSLDDDMEFGSMEAMVFVSVLERGF
jgi:hypothetical protein